MNNLKKLLPGFLSIVIITALSCQSPKEETRKSIQLITLDPGHFHAALVQKTMYDDIDSLVHVYAPGGNDLQLHLDRINAYNSRKDNPTHWKEDVYTGNDFFEKMIAEKKGNAVVLSGNNEKKADYILKSLQNGFNVFADKPMVIDGKGFEELKQAFDVAQKNNLVLYDIMTERYEITTILQRELSMMPEIFGTLEKGTADDPSVVMKSEHNFYKYVSGSVVVRPGWFMDASQQGDGIVDVSTHLIDLVQWESFPEQSLNYNTDIIIDSARHWPTPMTISQFKTITKLDSFPSYFNNNKRNDSTINVWSNGAINFQVKGVHAKVSVVWEYQTASGNDTHYSLMKGTKANLEIKQAEEEKYQPTLYIEPLDKNFDPSEAFKKIQSKYAGVQLKKSGDVWQVIIPDKYKEGHEQHFARVTEKFLDYVKNRNMPAWEIPNMITKYFITTKALEIASKNKQ
jgi:predicted dehydrogenase